MMTNKRPFVRHWKDCVNEHEVIPQKKRAIRTIGALTPSTSSQFKDLDYTASDSLQPSYLENAGTTNTFPISPAFSGTTEADNNPFIPSSTETTVLEDSLVSDSTGVEVEDLESQLVHDQRLCFGMVRDASGFSNWSRY